jgi:hypothetical protein
MLHDAMATSLAHADPTGTHATRRESSLCTTGRRSSSWGVDASLSSASVLLSCGCARVRALHWARGCVSACVRTHTCVCKHLVHGCMGLHGAHAAPWAPSAWHVPPFLLHASTWVELALCALLLGLSLLTFSGSNLMARKVSSRSSR